MFLEKFKSIAVVVFMLVVTGFAPVVFAGDAVPTDKDVQFAGQFYVIFRNVVDYNKDLEDQITIDEDYDKSIDTIKTVMNKRLEYAQKTLDKLEAITPTKDFEAAYNEVVSGVKEDMDYVKSIIALCDKKETIEAIDDKENVLKNTTRVYLDAKDKFVIIVKNWQDEFVQKVEEIYSNAKSEE